MITLTTKQKRWAIACGAMLLLIITNPSISAFKAYIGSNTYRGLERPLNFFICSVYRYGGEKYLGVVGNFMTWPKFESATHTSSKQLFSKKEKKDDPFAEFGGHRIK